MSNAFTCDNCGDTYDGYPKITVNQISNMSGLPEESGDYCIGCAKKLNFGEKK